MPPSPRASARRHLRAAAAALLLPLTLGLAGCWPNDDSTPAASGGGVFVDSPVAGLGYVTTGWAGLGNDAAWQSLSTSTDGKTAVAAGALNRQGIAMFTRDGGNTWNRITLPDTRADYATAVSGDGQHLYVSTSTGVVRSANGGSTWTTTPTTAPLVSLAASADGMKVVAVNVQDDSIDRSTDGGATWTHVLTNANYSLFRIAITPDGNTIAAPLVEDRTSYAPSVTQARGGVMVSTDGGATWQRRGSGYYRDIAISDNGQIMLAASTDLVLWRSLNGGATWTRTSLEGIGTVSVSSNGKTVMAGELGGQAYVSRDSGTTWSATSTDNHDWRASAMSADGKITYASGGLLGFFGTQEETEQLYVARDDGLRTTAADGSYKCTSGQMVTFYLGNFLLGSARCTGITQVYQMTGIGDSVAKGLRIAQLLQSLNTSSDPSKIVLPDLSTLSIDVKLDGTDSEFTTSANSLLTAAGTATGKTFKLVSAGAAVTHVTSELAKLTGTQRSELCSVNTCNSALLGNISSFLTQRLGGTVTGLPPGKSIKLTATLGTGTLAPLVVASNGAWNFLGDVPATTSYAVSVTNTDPSFSCTSTATSGTMPVGDVSTIAIKCTANTQQPSQLKVTVSGLSPNQSVTLVNGTDAVVASANGTYAFSNKVTAGVNYAVTVGTVQPDGLSCTVTNGTGTAPNSYTATIIDNITVACTGAPTYSIGGTMSGLPAGETVQLQNDYTNASSVLTSAFVTIGANGSYSFSEGFLGNYVLSLASVPAGLDCTLSSTFGSAAFPKVTVDVTCSGARLSGLVSGLGNGATVTLDVTTSAGNSQVLVTGNGGGVSFNTRYFPSGTTYAVTVASTSAGTSCGSVSNGSGTLGSSNVTNLALTCSTSGGGGPAAGSISGTVTGVPMGGSVMITNTVNNDTTSVLANGSFTMPTGLAGGDSYTISAIDGSPPGPNPPVTCVVTNASGTMPAAPGYVSNVSISCN